MIKHSGTPSKNLPMFALWLTAGLVLIVAAWLVPVNMKSVTPVLLREAGRGSPSVAVFGRELLDSEKLGPAQLALAAAQLGGDKLAPVLENSIRDVATRRPEWLVWGGWDPFLEPLINQKESVARAQSTPVLTFFITEKSRSTLLRYLVNTRSLGVQSLLQTREVVGTTRFIPATQPGGQTLDAVVLLTALLYQSDNLSGPLQRELRGLAEQAVLSKQLGDLETFYIDLLSLGKRLNWTQLCELVRKADSVKTVGEFAHLSRVAADNLPIIYTAALFSESADQVASYLIQYGKAGLEDLRTAMTYGRGAVRLLLLNQLPVNREPAPSLGWVAEVSILNPRVALAVKYLCFFLGSFLLLRGLEEATHFADERNGVLRLKSGVLACLLGIFFILGTEPFLLKKTPASEFKFKFVIPALASPADALPVQKPVSITTMDTTTLISIGFFASLQIGMYFVCLLKIREISRQSVSALVKLRLMENEENLFDGGLYIGIGGTATALVLQVLGVIDPNLLAAYSSNLFGITCVAMVKIRHVRPFKRILILEGQTSVPVSSAAPIVAKTVASAS